VSPDTRPDRHALLELQALLAQIAALRSEGDADRFTADARYRWILHRLWIAAGNEALAYTQATGQPVRADRTWANLYDLRNHLAHSRLPDIDEGLVRRSPGHALTPSRPLPSTTCKHDPRAKPMLATPVHAVQRTDRRSAPIARLVHLAPPGGA
jgi:hypothetical protein